MKIENSSVFNFESAVRAIKPLSKSDSKFGLYKKTQIKDQKGIIREYDGFVDYAEIGARDMRALKKEIKKGRLLNNIQVSFDIVASLEEFDKISCVVADRKSILEDFISKSSITIDCFDIAHLTPSLEVTESMNCGDYIGSMIDFLEGLKSKISRKENIDYYKEILFMCLPLSWKTRIRYNTDYETIRKVIKETEEAKISSYEQKILFDYFRTLPYAEDFLFEQ